MYTYSYIYIYQNIGIEFTTPSWSPMVIEIHVFLLCN